MRTFSVRGGLFLVMSLAACAETRAVSGNSAGLDGEDAIAADAGGGSGDGGGGATADSGQNDTTAGDAAADAGAPDGGAADGGGGDGSAVDSGAADGGATTDAAGEYGPSGTFVSNFGGYEEIHADTWNEMTVTKWDNGKRYAIAQNPADDKYNPSKFSKLVWTLPKAGTFYYCTVDFGLATAALAEATTRTADDSDPGKGGCGGFAWTALTATATIAIEGKYSDNFGGKSSITSRFWDTAWITKFDNTARYAITQNASDDKYNPNKFSKVVWTEPTGKDGSFWVCTVDFGLGTAALAEATTKIADASAPDKSGCGGFAWTKLTP